MLRIFRVGFFVILSLFMVHSALASTRTAPVAGFARSFIFGKPITRATITVLETGQTVTTDSQGKFGPFLYPVGKPITLRLDSMGYQSTQSATVIVPREGLVGPYDNITFQVPSIGTYYLLATVIDANMDKNSCHVAATVTAYHKTMDDIPQGEENATVTLTPTVISLPFYFDIFKSGLLKGKTNPFTKGLEVTSLDGGVAYFNLPPREEPYTLSAVKPGVIFTEVKFLCRPNTFINLSPPRGPMALQ